VRVDPRYTSQDCSDCGDRSGKKPLHIRKWTCEVCGSVHDRDINAAMNIQARAVPSGDNVSVSKLSVA
jgi:putative transposase